MLKMLIFFFYLWRVGTTPGANENLSCGFPSIPELLRELWFPYCSSRGTPFRKRNFVFRERNFEFRKLLRECSGTLRELREWPFHSESFFSEIGVVVPEQFFIVFPIVFN